MVSPRAHLEKNHEFKSGTNESQLKKETSPKWKMIWPLCNQTVNLKTDYKTLYTEIKIQSFYFKAQQRLKEICIVK